jgi:TatD DNase family protein
VWFDSHCHLHICEESEPAEELLARARAHGVTKVLTAGVDIASSERSVELSSAEGVYAAVGIHPNSATQWSDSAQSRIEELVARPEVVAVGESGLDFYRDEAPRDAQEEAFSAHIELAKRHGKALVIHTRDSVDAAMTMLESLGPPQRFVFHCWSGDTAQLQRALDLGGYVSFAGNVSFPSAEGLRALSTRVPDDRLLVETDSPYLTPVPHRGRRNEPGNVVLVGSAVAEARGAGVEDIELITSRNACKFFGIL